MNRAILLSLMLLLLGCSGCMNTRIKNKKEWQQVFDKYGVQGCFELYDNNKEIAYYYNRDRCATRYSPASTFKIFNSLVALETGVAPTEEMVIKWDGIKRWNDKWNQDLTMAQAFKYSAVPYYQELARRIGVEKMKKYIDTVKYGNMDINGPVDSFWLNDTLQITADEQVGLLKRLYWKELPGFSDRSQRIVTGIMLQLSKDDYKLYYKTGTTANGLYWIVGFVETIHHLKNVETKQIDNIPHAYFFAMNFSAPDSTKDWNSLRLDMLNEVLATLDLNFK